MKRIILSSIFLFCFCSIAKSEGLMYGGEPVMRTSITHTTETNAVIATANVVMKIQIQTAGSSNAYLEVFSNGVLRDHIDCSNNNNVSPYLTRYSTPTYSNYGDTPCYAKFYWDWYEVHPLPRGQENKGY